MLDSRREPASALQNTNVVKLCSLITKSDKQLTHYRSGLGAVALGAGAPLGLQLSNNLDMAIGRYVILSGIIAVDLIHLARNLHKVIMASYRWLSDNYQDGDRLFLFGKILSLTMLILRMSHSSRLFAWCLPGSSVGGHDCSSKPPSLKNRCHSINSSFKGWVTSPRQRRENSIVMYLVPLVSTHLMHR